ncbi:hypothetical protein FHS31_000226 [Sphingomonas vulcanisoli]|uniref:DUF1311 domain-containing protein n=1 Tax=Sphingomonas vulcanisoli TaxID=1658060 RepID=A0ABX0TPG3_9SPHN|nr:hypothetical protein [Sphingomonas vulcanisoli]NIJ06644.1 hypothetical protein [Sphingomonas vulcanisoli]
MDLHVLDQRLRAFEKKLNRFEKYLRSPDFRTGRLIIAGCILLGLAAVGAYYGYRYLRLSNERVDRIDSALATNYPSYESDYCHWLHSDQDGYTNCLRDEQKAFIKFEAAWHRSQPVAALREQMIGCFNGAQNQYGMSWKTAADCSELTNDLPEDRPPGN